MRRTQWEMIVRNNEDLRPFVPDKVVGFAYGWATSWINYEMGKTLTGSVDVDAFHHYEDWELNLVLNPESLSLEVVAYPYIDEDEVSDFSYPIKIANVPVPLGTPVRVVKYKTGFARTSK